MNTVLAKHCSSRSHDNILQGRFLGKRAQPVPRDRDVDIFGQFHRGGGLYQKPFVADAYRVEAMVAEKDSGDDLPCEAIVACLIPWRGSRELDILRPGGYYNRTFPTRNPGIVHLQTAYRRLDQARSLEYSVDPIGGPKELCHRWLSRKPVKLLRRSLLQQVSAFHHTHSVRQLHGLQLIVGH